MCQRVRGGVCGAVCARVGVSEQPREGDLKQPRNDTNNEQNRAKLKKRKEEARKSALKQAKRDNIEFKNNLKPILIKSNLKLDIDIPTRSGCRRYVLLLGVCLVHAASETD